MAIKGFDFELNGVKYNAAEDAEGDHYSDSGEPLRPPNAVTVQGENSQKFQMRPDTLLWTLTDWSGGEGQRKYDAQSPNRSFELNAVSVFERPGTLRPGPYIEDTQDSSGSSDLAIALIPVVARGALYGYARAAANWYLWDSGNDKWGTAQAITGPASGVRAVVSDGDFIYTLENGASKLWRATPADQSPTAIATSVISATSRHICENGDNVYVLGQEGNLSIYEVSKSASTPTEIDTFTMRNTEAAVLSLNGKVYAMASNGVFTEVREIVPTTAAGGGFGRQFARLDGFAATTMWAHDGLLFFVGRFSDSEETAVFYMVTDGTYGTLGALRRDDNLGGGFSAAQSMGGNQRLLDHFFMTEQRSASDSKPALWQIDSISGGMCNFAYAADTDTTSTIYNVVATFEDDIFFAGNENTLRMLRAKGGTFAKNANAVSPWHDFDLADEKILSSIMLSVEALPADWTVHVDYGVNGATAWTNVISYTTTNGFGVKTAVSTDTATKKIQTMRIRIRFEYTGGGVPTSSPVVLGVDVYAMVLKPQRVWRLLLDLSDDHSARGGQTGAKKAANIRTASATEGLVDFKDGYEDRGPNKFTTYDVGVDAYRIVMTKPGEGFAAVTLKENP